MAILDLRFFSDYVLNNQEGIAKDLNWADFFCYGGQLRSVFASRINRSSQHEIVEKKLIQILEQTRNRNRNILKASEIIKDEFSKMEIQVLFIKGVASLLTHYCDNLEARSLSDIDIIVPNEHYQQAKIVLTKLGWTEDYSNRGLGDHLEAKKWFEENHFHSIFKNKNVIVELHKNISYGFKEESLKLLFETSIEAHSGFRIPSPEFQIVNFLLNFIHDYTINLGYYWYLQNQGLVNGFAFIFLAHEIKLILKYYQNRIDYNLLNAIILNCEERDKLNFLLKQVSFLINAPELNLDKNKDIFKFCDPLKCLLVADCLFVNNSVPKLTDAKPRLECFFRYLFLFSKLNLQKTPLGKIKFWLHSLYNLLNPHNLYLAINGLL